VRRTTDDHRSSIGRILTNVDVGSVGRFADAHVAAANAKIALDAGEKSR